jgi:hypothetical protein
MKDIDEIRRDNLRMIEAEKGGPAAAAAACGMSQAQFTNLRDGAKDSKTGKRRGMRAATARKIENRTGKPGGWMDQDHAPDLAVSARETKHVPTGWEQLDEIGRGQVEAFIKGLLSRPPEAPSLDDDERPRGD